MFITCPHTQTRTNTDHSQVETSLNTGRDNLH